MNILSDKQKLNVQTVATIGFFDGVHIGHRFLLSELKTMAQKTGFESLVISFNNSPQKTLHPEKNIKYLSTPSEKTQLFADLGISNCLMLDFNTKIAQQNAETFLMWLKEMYGVKILLIGHDHRFGKDKISTFETYQKLGEKLNIEITQCSKFEDNGRQVSSSIIRLLISNGDIKLANQLLDYTYSITGKVIHGNKIGRTIGFPTANLKIDSEKLIPKNGVYIIETCINNQSYKGLLNIGTRPTIDGNNQTIETHLIDFNKDIYDEKITLHIKKRLRDEIKFSSITELQQQIEIDRKLLYSM
ncbi:MAG: bifunctional riboflavin kinase/FAD synthetase [Paludibacteraceae bacterium]|nr:bifunctional riboflavin kinase/FAD synthetase [Paludibacteraceae bacterium]